MARATLIGFSAVAMWALLALLDRRVGRRCRRSCCRRSPSRSARASAWPRALSHRRRPTAAKIPRQVWLIGIAGLFGYHFFYFTALRNAPAVEASLIAYLWPLLIVLGSALMPGERLRWNHVAGALLGLAGTVLIVTKGGGLAFESRYAFGYAMAGVCAFLWSAYSLLSRRFPAVPTSIVTWFCAATSALSLACHLALEETVLPPDAGQWLAVLGLGLMPVGAAFYAWDIGVKRGNIQVLGAASYAAPLAVDADADRRRLRRAEPAHPRRLPADHRRRGACGQVAAVRRASAAADARGLTAQAPITASGSQPGSASSNGGEVEAGRHRAADQRPVAQAPRGLPAIGRHDRLRPLARRRGRCRAGMPTDAAAFLRIG